MTKTFVDVNANTYS